MARALRRAPCIARLVASCLALWLCGAAPARAQVRAEQLRVTGFWPDAAVALGGGIGVAHRLDSNVMARLRAGGLYAYEPFIINFGLTAEVGALAGYGAGAELELNHFGGGFLRAGLSRVRGGRFMSQLALGFTVVGVEWHHRYPPRRSDAVLFSVRLPLGIWWFLLAREAQ